MSENCCYKSSKEKNHESVNAEALHYSSVSILIPKLIQTKSYMPLVWHKVLKLQHLLDTRGSYKFHFLQSFYLSQL